MVYICSTKLNNSALLAGKSVINSLEDLYKAVADQSARLIEIENDFADEFFTPKSLAIFIKEAKALNRFLEVHISESKKYNIDKSIDRLRRLKTKEELVSFVLQNKDSLAVINSLCEFYKKEQTETLQASAKLSTMHLEQSALTKELALSNDRYSVLEDLHQISLSKLETLVSRINFKYGVGLDENKLLGFKVDFRKYHKILYLKEITRVKLTDTLLYYLQEILRTLYGVPTKFVVIEPAYAYDRISLYPNCKSHINLSYADVYKSDIFMAGFQSSLMEDILRNPMDIKFLIILDRSGWKSPYIYGDGVEHVYSVSDLKDLKDNISLRRILSYNKDTLHIPYIEGFDNLSMEEKIGKYSSMETMHALIDLMERSD